MATAISASRVEAAKTHGNGWLIGATAGAILPIVVATVSALSDGWTAVADNGYFLVRSRDVLSEHMPLLGTWSSSSLTLGFDVNNPGPWLFYLLAVPTKLWGSAGLVVGIAALNIAVIVGIAYALARNAGPAVATLGLLAVTGLGWTMGRPLLVDPWQPHSLLHAFALFLVLAWVTAAGDRWMLPWTAGVAILLVQTHLSYVYVVPTVSLVATLGLVHHVLRRDLDVRPWERLAVLRAPVLVTVAVAFALWSPSILEQVRARDRGNLFVLLDAAGSDAPTLGFDQGVRRSSEVLAIWPTWLRPSFREDRLLGEPVTLWIGLLALAIVATVLVGAGWWAWHRRDRLAFACVIIAGLAASGGVFTATGIIETRVGVAPHHFRYLWPIAIFVQLAVAVVVVRSLGAELQRRSVPVIAALVVVLAIANLPDIDAPAGVEASLTFGPAVQSMNAQLGALEDRGTVLVDSSRRPLADPFTAPLYAELSRRGIDFVVDDDIEIAQLGPSRADGGDADVQVFLRWGPGALAEQSDAERIAFASALDEEETATWVRVRGELVAAIERGHVELTTAGRDAARAGELALDVGDDDRIRSARALDLAERGAFHGALEEGWIVVDGLARADVEAWLELHPLLRTGTVAVWLTEPPGSQR